MVPAGASMPGWALPTDGSSAIAANSIANSLFQVVSVMCYGLASAAGVLIGKAVGSGEREKLKGYVDYMHIKDALPTGKVVPPGMGAGNVPAIVARYAARGGEVLSLEPHLSNFVGLKALEQEGDESIVGDMKFESTEAAFDFAANNLYRIVEGM